MVEITDLELLYLAFLDRVAEDDCSLHYDKKNSFFIFALLDAVTKFRKSKILILVFLHKIVFKVLRTSSSRKSKWLDEGLEASSL